MDIFIISSSRVVVYFSVVVFVVKLLIYYSVESRIFMETYRLLYFAKDISKNLSKNLSGKSSQKLLDHAKQSASDALKITSQRLITEEATGDLIGNEI